MKTESLIVIPISGLAVSKSETMHSEHRLTFHRYIPSEGAFIYKP
jgi:hypothetical protein